MKPLSAYRTQRLRAIDVPPKVTYHDPLGVTLGGRKCPHSIPSIGFPNSFL